MKNLTAILFFFGLISLAVSPMITGCRSTPRTFAIVVPVTPQPVCNPVNGSLDMFGQVWTNVNTFSPAEIDYINRQNAAQGL